MHYNNHHKSPLVTSHKVPQHTFFSSFLYAAGVRQIRLQVSMANVFRRVRKIAKSDNYYVASSCLSTCLSVCLSG
jgi:hypothetical protein